MHSSRIHTNNFDAIRLFAAYAVVVSHHFALSRLPEPSVFTFHSLGGLGVVIFFSISGYLVAQSWDRDPHLWRFTARRFLRIWPGLLVTLALSALVLGPIVTTLPLDEYLRDRHVWSSFGILWLDVQPRLPGIFLTSPLPEIPNGALWTIPIEVKCYIALAVLGLLGIFRRPRLFALLVAGLAVYVYGIYDTERVIAAGGKRLFKWEFATFFFTGALLHYFHAFWAPASRQVLIAAVLILGAALSFWAERPLVACWLLVPFLVIAIGLRSTPVLCRFGRFGDFSYGIYIYGFPVQQTVLWALPELPFLHSLAMTILMTTALACASWHLVEKRALRLKPSSKKRLGDLASESRLNVYLPSGTPARQHKS